MLELELTFGEYRCRLREGHADANFSAQRRTALSLLKNELTAKVGIRNQRLIAGWSDDYLAKVLSNEFSAADQPESPRSMPKRRGERQ